MLLDNELGVSFGDFLDVHATGGRTDQDGAELLGAALHGDGEVVLAAGIASLDDKHLFAGTTLLTGLLRHQVAANHLLGKGLGILGSVDDFDAALETGNAILLEVTLAASAGEDLGFDDAIGRRQLLGNVVCFLGRVCDVTFGRFDAVVL